MSRKLASKPTQTPFVSVVCPTYQRREFLPYLLYIWQYQDYPPEQRELIILDDSPQSSAELVSMILQWSEPNVRYLHIEKRLALGEKRNMLNDMARGEYIICFDDDDYYAPDKISYQVAQMLNSNALFSGCDQIYIWYSHLDKVYLTHPFGKRHALNGTFGYHRNLLKKSRYENGATMGEEAVFLKGFTLPVLQVDPRRSILCISHSNNTFDKDFIMGSSIPVDLTLEDFVTDSNLLAHYRRLHNAPLATQVHWPAFQRIALLYEPEKKLELEAVCESLYQFGISAEQLWPVEKQTAATPELAELKTHCHILQTAQEQGWQNVLLLDATIRFVKKENTIHLLNKLLNGLTQINWQVLLLGARYEAMAMTKTLKGIARITDAGCGCAYAVNGQYIPILLNAYQQAIENNVSLDVTWRVLMNLGHLWLGLAPSFAFLPESRDPKSGKTVDSTHWFFRKPHS
ncbi:glycosyl transferase family 2 [Chania multitudinisentens RB-25]|uniref:Glycosyl transferase family 2 n=2 Tax=Chania TaxID=1745211 RepID=W0LB91_9GAMM|nr:glycosyl transferase family 2 [Chania multitudinisentens RB-25]